MVALRCTFLLGRYQAADPFRTAADGEWPPHPYRLHAALLGAACEAGGREPTAGALDALRWLEAQGPPGIHHRGRRWPRTAATTWVPRNPTPGSEWDRMRKSGSAVVRVGRVLPTVALEDPGVTFSWPNGEGWPAELDRLAAGITWLGSSRSPVACAVTDVDEPPDYLPDASGPLQMRVASPGLTDALMASRFEHPPSATPVVAGYRRAAPAIDRKVHAAPFSELVVRRVVGAVQDLADTATITTALRAAVLARAGDDAPPALHGHADGRGHAAYLAIGDVGHARAPGTVRGVALALPDDVGGEERRACVAAFAAVNPLALPAERRPLVLDDDVGELATLAPERWQGPSTTWATVTPVVLDRHPRRGTTPEDALRGSLRNAGLPDPAAVEVLAGPAVAGAPLAARLRGDLPPGLRVHARVRFGVPVRGPVLAGRGRFRGIGLLLPDPRR